MRRAPLTDAELALLREAAEADFHATPPTVLALLDMLDDYRERWRSLVEQTLGDPPDYPLPRRTYG